MLEAFVLASQLCSRGHEEPEVCSRAAALTLPLAFSNASWGWSTLCAFVSPLHHIFCSATSVWELVSRGSTSSACWDPCLSPLCCWIRDLYAHKGAWPSGSKTSREQIRSLLGFRPFAFHQPSWFILKFGVSITTAPHRRHPSGNVPVYSLPPDM